MNRIKKHKNTGKSNKAKAKQGYIQKHNKILLRKNAEKVKFHYLKTKTKQQNHDKI